MENKDVFRATFPKFCDTSIYPDSVIDLWGNLATQLVDQEKFGTMYETALFLATCHFLTMFGSAAGDNTAAMQSKKVGSVSITYATSIDSTIDGAGLWNQTQCGRQLYHLIKLSGSGCIQL